MLSSKRKLEKCIINYSQLLKYAEDDGDLRQAGYYEAKIAIYQKLIRDKMAIDNLVHHEYESFI